MSKSKLIRLSGFAAIIAGALRAVATFTPSDASAAEPLYLCIDFFILLTAIGLYAHRHNDIGGFGFAGFLLAVAGVLIIRSSHAFPTVNLYPAGALILSVGLIILGAVLYRVSALPVWPVVFWSASLLLGMVASLVSNPALPFIAAGLAFSIGLWSIGFVHARAAS